MIEIRGLGMRFFKKCRHSILSGISILYFASTLVASDTGYYRTPGFGKNSIIFSSEGDLWRASINGGEAYRLTTHQEEELTPFVSPDGNWIAFSASYDGGVEAYVMPMGGGVPKQVSFDNGLIFVRGWTPDGQVIYTSTLANGPTARIIKTVNPVTMTTNTLPLADANHVTYKPDGNTLFFTRFGLENNRDNAKLYRGGGMAQIWRYEVNKNHEAVRLAVNFGAPVLYPMWSDGRIYFVSDKNGADNIWSMDERGNDIKEHTKHSMWDVRAPQVRNGKIIYQLGADIRVFDTSTNTDQMIDISIISDQDYKRQHWEDKPLNYLSSAKLSPTGKNVTLTARGRVTVASPGPLRRVEFQIPGQARARSAIIGAEGNWVYAILDNNQRGEIWRYPVNGIGNAEQLTDDASHHRWDIIPSPDGKYLAHYDKSNKLWLLNLKTKENREVDQSPGLGDNNFSDFSWTKNGRYLSYTTGSGRGISQVRVYDIENGNKETVTSSKYEAFGGTFSPDGKWLYFLSNRQFRATPGSPWGDRNLGPQFDKRTKIYALALDEDARFPFAPDNELSVSKLSNKKEEKVEKAEEDNRASEKEKKAAKTIDLKAAKNRLYAVPVPSGNYASLKAVKGALYLLDRSGNNTELKHLKITNKRPKLSVFASNVSSYDISADGKSLFYALGGGNANRDKMYIVKAGAKAPKDLSNAQLRTKDWRLSVKPREEWRQLFLDAWRLHRDFAFDPNLRGLDWDAIREKYEALLDRVGHRSELTELIGQMTSELGILHSQLGTGDIPRDSEKSVASHLGATFETLNEGLKIKHIFQTEADLPEQAGPLAKVDVDVSVGDIITAVNGRAISSEKDLATTLAHQANQQVILTLKRKDNEPHHVVVRPTNGFGNFMLRYRDWVEGRKSLTTELAGNDSIGYLHIRAMGSNDIADFARNFYEHWDKDGIVIDVRSNRGGNIDSWIIEKLLRKVWAFWHFNGRKQPYGNMQQTFRGHVAFLINEGTYSDGETFAAGVKALNLGPLIGTQTAGAGIWLSDRNRLSDGGIARVAESAQFGLDGRWLIEGRGVSPDIEVINLPQETYNGRDAQLERAVNYLQEKIRSKPIPEFKAQPIPPVGEAGHDVR
jgi:tricorn protease